MTGLSGRCRKWILDVRVLDGMGLNRVSAGHEFC
jgi:hypothetical protein